MKQATGPGCRSVAAVEAELPSGCRHLRADAAPAARRHFRGSSSSSPSPWWRIFTRETVRRRRPAPLLRSVGSAWQPASAVRDDGLAEDGHYRGPFFRPGPVLRVHGDHQAHAEAEQGRLQRDEKGVQELRQGIAGPEEDRDQLSAAPQDHRLPGGGLRRGAHPGAGQAQGRCQLPAAAGHAGRPVLPPAGGRSPEAVRPRAGLWHPAHLPAAHRPPERRAAGEGGRPRGAAAHERPGEEQGQAVLRSSPSHFGPSHSERGTWDCSYSNLEGNSRSQ